MLSLKDVAWHMHRPKRARRYLLRMLDTATGQKRASVFSMLAYVSIREQDFSAASHFLKLALSHAKPSMASVFDLRMLSVLYKLMGLRWERFDTDSQRISLLKKLLIHADDVDEADAISLALKTEMDDRGIDAASFGNYFDN